MINIVEKSHQLIETLKPIDCAVDMTCGNGLDTLFLANIAKRVVAFDIQADAIQTTANRLKELKITHVTLIHESHENISRFVFEPVDVVIFNLGYRPGGNPQIRTTPRTTTLAIQSAIPLLKRHGKIILVLYPKNHDNEAEIIRSMCQSLPGNIVDCMEYRLLNKQDAPT
jgi:tRNA1(Val) A37 N6-methylase TrmN6